MECCSTFSLEKIAVGLYYGWSRGAMDPLISLGLMLCIGAAAGWFASIILHGEGLGMVGNVVAGIAGAYVGRWLFDYLRIPPISNWSYMGEFIYGLVGALILLLIFGRFFIHKNPL